MKPARDREAPDHRLLGLARVQDEPAMGFGRRSFTIDHAQAGIPAQGSDFDLFSPHNEIAVALARIEAVE